jgi:hypothetical protein
MRVVPPSRCHETAVGLIFKPSYVDVMIWSAVVARRVARAEREIQINTVDEGLL